MCIAWMRDSRNVYFLLLIKSCVPTREYTVVISWIDSESAILVGSSKLVLDTVEMLE